jgi:hypothetical protein
MKPAIRFIPTFVGFLCGDPDPVDQGTFDGRLMAKRRELGPSKREAACSIQIGPGTWAAWELVARMTRKAHTRAVEMLLGSDAG